MRADGLIEWLIEWDYIDDETGKKEQTWEVESNVVGTADEAIHEFMGSIPSPAGCKHGHHPAVCKCRQPLWHLGQDEKIWKAFQKSRAT